MQAVILGQPGWHADELRRALEARGHAGRVVPYESLVASFGGGRAEAGALLSGQEPVLDADAVLARFIPAGSLEQIIYRVDALHWIEDRGVAIVNSPRAIERSVDKFCTDARLRAAGVPTPETFVCERAADAMTAIRAILGCGPALPTVSGTGPTCLARAWHPGPAAMSRAVVIKPIFGSMGHGIVRVTDPDVAFRVVQTLEQLRSVFYVQRAIESGGRDIRVFVVGGRVLGAIERRAAAGDWRTNVSRGGSARPIDLPPDWESIALRATAAIGADYAGVDLLPSIDGEVFVLEVNGIPGWQGLQRATGIDVAGAVVDHLVERVRSRRSAAVGQA